MIELKQVTKRYKKFLALTDFSYRFLNGSAYGILGVNGAGKSTLINCITKNISFQGDLKFVDLSIWDIGYVPQELAIYPELSVLDNLLFFASTYKMDKKYAKERSLELIEKAGLKEKISTMAKDLSGGMKRKLNLITALVHNPKLLICDEVCVGIDPISRSEILEYLKDLKNEGLNIIYTSHYLDEVEFLCNKIIFLDKGKLILEGDTKELIDKMSEVSREKSNLSDLFMQVLRGGEYA
ncbi:MULTISPECIES: ABC transporter ATP-binding protein [unclassified Treponema]|uniref:ABC transporter ATP-binding protein n=1 Tax=unclassified Treponema TaxID=2638727 RepID=UPI0020A50F3E|nr:MULTISPECIES: ABC transporter ATP-binding protein [unclassified Treponema]UTC66147.1 ABC transporter ATP-binding protein [Treponema sp. OMZ 789]UTC68876.1 ABC transporter ATP-binding protein [Treponema sp. OMZ 790]UTC71604.1 ABC transporter ATP-binding protein [Treponema sp. OMZ 791]